MCGVRDSLADSGQERRTADLLEISRLLQTIDQQRDVDPLARVVHILHVGEQQPVRFVVEILVPNERGNLVAHIGLEQDTAQHTQFGVQIVRGLPVEDFGRSFRGPPRGIGAPHRCHEQSLRDA